LNSNRLVEIIPGLYQIRLEIPIRSLGYVYSYFAEDGEDNLLIDTGWPSEKSFIDLENALKEIDVPLTTIGTIIISHLHPDHFGLAEQIRDLAPDSKLLIHESDTRLILESYEDYKGFIAQLHYWLSQNGTPEEELKAMLEASSEMLNFFRPPKPTGIVKGEEIIKVGKKWNFQVIPTPGHTIGNICLYDRKSKVLFSGDHILPTITPNISLGPFYMGDPLGDYLNSLDRVNQLDVDLVLPSHEYVFSNLREKVQEIKAHHDERLNEAITLLRTTPEHLPMSGYWTASKLKWHSGPWDTLGPWERRAAVMETLAHLEYLKRRGKIVEVDESMVGHRLTRFTVP
jgi:glyoxylase-like metal-dependent hydrolase (beta-lactamase superfamily II)